MKKSLIGLALAASLSLPTTAVAQQHCAARDMIVTSLTDKYGEEFSGGGLRDGAAIFEVWVSKLEGTWTILMTRADGTACIMASGTNWREGAIMKPAMGIPG